VTGGGCDSRRVFVLGPAHHVHLTGCALSSTQTYRTPIYDLTIDNQGLTVTDCLIESQNNHRD